MRAGHATMTCRAVWVGDKLGNGEQGGKVGRRKGRKGEGNMREETKLSKGGAH